MLKRYTILIQAFIFGWFSLNQAIAGTPDHQTSALYVHQQVQAGQFSMTITSLSAAGAGEGIVFVPFMHRPVNVVFDQIAVDESSELLSGTLRAGNTDLVTPDYRSTEQEANAYLQMAYTNEDLPRVINSDLEAAGLKTGDHDLVMTDLFFTPEGAWMNASYIVQNPDGRVTTFSKSHIAVAQNSVSLCDEVFYLTGGPQTPEADAALPILIKAYNPDTGKGTFVSFSCDGFEGFHLEGEYHFDTQHLRLTDKLSPQDSVIAAFSIETEVWGQFSAAVTFNGPFEIRGVDDVVITIVNASIDYSDSQNPADTAVTNYLAPLNLGPNKNIWRGFFIKDISVQLPASLSVNNGSRVTVQAQNLIYDRSRGLTTNFLLLGKPTIAAGNLEGWGIDLKRVALRVQYSSPKTFEITGDINIPLVKEPIPYSARFNFPSGAGVTSTKASLQFQLNLTNEYTVPLLKNAKMTLTNSVAGFEYTNSKFTPYAHLNGTFKLEFSSNDPGVAADFKFPTLGFQSLTLNYDASTSKVVPEATASGGLKTLAIRAFTFAGQTFNNSAAAPPATPVTPVAETGAAATTPQQSVKGFPIAIRDIKFGSVGDDKKLDFTIALNFTSPSVGLTASAALSVIGRLDVAKVITSAPWEALSFRSLELNSILIGSQAQPVNIGGVSLYGGLVVIRKDPTYGDGFKGFLVMTVEPGITVEVVGQFGTISRPDNSLDYRYFFADAKATFQSGIRLGPAPVAVYGFGGGFYYNMEQGQLPTSSSLEVSSSTPPNPALSAMSPNLLVPGQGFSCIYKPKNNVLGVKASVVLGTHPNPATANMDLTLNVEFNTSPFGLRLVSLRGDAYFMAPITKRNQAKVKGYSEIIYNNTSRTLMFNGGVTVAVTAGPKTILSGGGSFGMFFNLNPGQSSDWYMAIGAPPIAKRMRLTFDLGTKQTFEGYFVAGNLSSLPPDQRNLPLLREYDPLLQEFEGKNNLNLAPLMNGQGILMGARYGYAVSKKIWIITANLGFTVGFDAILTQENCAGHTPTGVDNWYLRGQIYGALSGSLKIRVNLLFHKGTYTIASISAAALVTAELPNPTYMEAQLSGKYRILGGLVKGSFKITVDFGEKCVPVQDNLNPGDVVAKIKVIGDILPADGTKEIPIFREKLIVASYLERINGVMDYSEESDDGLMVKPIINSMSISGPQAIQGGWKHFSESGVEVGPNGYFKSSVFNSTKLLAPKADYTFTLKVSWQMKTKDNGNWRDIILKDINGRDSVQYIETKVVKFTTANRPTELPREAVLASYPEYGALNYGILENPDGGGVALKQEGWGYLFNPKKRVKENASPCDPNIAEYNYFVRMVDVATARLVAERPLTAVPVPEWGKNVGDPIYTTQRPCITGNPFWDWLYRVLNISCDIVKQGPCAVLQPTAAAAQSNVKSMPNSWDFGGTARNFDLAVTQNTNINNKSIGFPDFSDVLEKGKVYRFELVGKPIVAEDTYTVSANQATEQTVNTSSGNYVVTENSNSLQGQFSTGAPEKILYQSHFATSQFNTLAEKLALSNPTYLSNDNWLLNVGQDTLFNNSSDFSVTMKFEINKTQFSLKTACYPVPSLYNGIYSGYSDLLGSIPQSPSTMNYSLNGISEGFDGYELGRFGYFASYNRNSGYVAYQIAEKPGLIAYEKANTFPFDNSIIPKGPYIFLLPQNQSAAFLSTTSISKPVGTTISLRFYPRTVSLYNIMMRNVLLDYYIKIYKSTATNLYTRTTAIADAQALATYENMPAKYGDLFSLKYKKGNNTANLAFNAAGKPSGSYMDYSGEYRIRNVGSGRVLSENSGKSAEYNTGRQVNDNYTIFKFERQSGNRYTVKNKGTGRNLGFNGVYLKGMATGEEVILLLQPNGTFKIQRASNSQLIYENQADKNIQVGEGTFYDYDLFTLEEKWEDAPEYLNNTYRLRVEANGRYLYDGNDRPGETLATVKDDKGNNAKFFLRRRANGFYDLTANSGRRIHAEERNGAWVYSTTNTPSPDESYYLFEPEKVSNLKYRFKNKKSGAYLYENFDISFGETHRQIMGSTVRPATDEAIFELAPAGTHTTPADLSGQYLFQNDGSGRNLYDDGSQISTSTQENSNAARFILKKVTAAGQYEIWNKGTQRRMHAADSGAKYQTVNTGLGAGEYRYTLTANNNGASYTISKAGTTTALYEKFDMALGSNHRLLQSTGSGDADYSRFKLLQEKNADGTDTGNKFVEKPDYSGRYFIQSQGSQRYLQYDPANPLFAENQTNFRKFVIKRRNGVEYEIWCVSISNGGRLYPKPAGGFTFDGRTSDANALFTFTPVNNAVQIVHKSTNNILFEHFEPGNANDRKLMSAASSGNHYARFLLTTTDNTLTDYTGTWFVRSKNSNRYWLDGNLTDNAPVFNTSTSTTAPGNKFKFTKQTNGKYCIESPENRFIKIFSTVINMGIQNNPDGSVALDWNNFSFYFSETNANTVTLNAAPQQNINFFLEPTTPNNNLSGEYRVQVQGSGRYLQFDASGTALSGTSDKIIVFQQQGPGVYALIDKATNKPLHAARDAAGNWYYTTATASGLPDLHYRFQLTVLPNNFCTLQCLANQEYLYEFFDLDVNSPRHQQLASAPAQQGEYGLFTLSNIYTPPPVNISGDWLLRSKGSGRYVHGADIAGGGLLTTTTSQMNDNYLHFILKRRASGQYEIWNKGSRAIVRASGNVPVSILNPAGISRDSLFFFDKKPNSDYAISTNISKLYEATTIPPGGVNHGQIWSTGAPAAGYDLFLLESNYLRPSDLSGQYTIRTAGSGRLISNNGGPVATSTAGNTAQLFFFLELQSPGVYKIKSKADDRYLHLTSGSTYTTAVESGLPADNYLFIVAPAANNMFRLQCVANKEWLYENFDLSFGAQHRQILSSTSQNSDYSYFVFESVYAPAPGDISGDYIIKLSANGRIWNTDATQNVITAWPDTDVPGVHFILKRRANGKYEIWNKQTLQQMRAVRNGSSYGFVANTSALANESNLQYGFELQPDGTYLITNTIAGKLDEITQGVLSTSLNAEKFRLESIFIPVKDVSGDYYIRTKSSNRHWLIANDLLTTTWSGMAAGIQFSFERQSNNAFKIKYSGNQKYLHTDTNNGFSTTAVSNLPASAYEFNITEITAGEFRIQSRNNDNFLFEFFDLDEGPLHRRIRHNNVAENEDNLILLSKTIILPNGEEISGSYFVSVKGSEGYINDIAGQPVSIGSAPQLWVFKPCGGGEFEIYNKASKGRLNALVWNFFSTSEQPGMPKDATRFVLTPDGPHFKFKYKFNQQFLIENFDITQLSENKRLLTLPTSRGDDGLFKLAKTYVAPPVTRPATYVTISAKGTNRFLAYSAQEPTGFTTRFNPGNIDEIQFVLRWRPGGFYEIWNKASGQRMGMNGGVLVSGGNYLPDNFQFSVNPNGGDAVLLMPKTANMFLTEMVQPAPFIRANFSLGVQGEDSQWQINTSYSPVNGEDLTGAYVIRVSGSTRYFTEPVFPRVQPNNNLTPNSYFLRRRANGMYEIWSVRQNTRLSNTDGMLVGSQLGAILQNTQLFNLTQVGNKEYMINNGNIPLREIYTPPGRFNYPPPKYDLNFGGNGQSFVNRFFLLNP